MSTLPVRHRLGCRAKGLSAAPRTDAAQRGSQSLSYPCISQEDLLSAISCSIGCVMEHDPRYPARVYFDTQSLLAHGWPEVNGTLQILFRDAAHLSIACLVPQPVLDELEARWLRDYRTDASAVGKLTRRLGRVGASTDNAIANESDALAAYRAHVKQAIASVGVHVSPVTKRLASEAFDYSLRRDLTFESDKDKGFQDAVILLSVLDHMDHSLPTVLISGDEAFSNMKVADFIKKSGAPLRVLRQLQLLRDDLDSYLSTQTGLLRRLDTLKIALAMNARLPELETFAASQVRFFPFMHSMPQVQIKAFDEIHLGRFDGSAVQVNWVEKSEPDAPLNITLRIPARLDLTVARTGYYIPPQIGVGETLPPPNPEVLATALTPTLARESWDAIVVVDGETTLADREFEKIALRGATLVGISRPNQWAPEVTPSRED